MPPPGADFDALSAALKQARETAPREPRRRHGVIRAAVIANIDDLLALRDAGYSDAEIADIFRDKGFKVAGGTLKSYINAERAAKLGPQRAAKATRGHGATKGSAAPAVKTARPSQTATRPAGSGKVRTALSHKPNEDV